MKLNVVRKLAGIPFVCFFLLGTSLASAADDFRVTLLGTGDPIPRIDRFRPATLVDVAGQCPAQFTDNHRPGVPGIYDT